MRSWLCCAAIVLVLAAARESSSAEPAAKPANEKAVNTERGDKMIAEYFRIETAKLREACLADIKTLDDWKAKRDEYRRQLREMLGLDPLPERTPLNAEVTGTVEQDDFVVENIHFQSRPGLYVTGNLYRPKKITERLPAILYLCGHGEVKKNGVSYGNKVHYQHHGAWFARNGYVCLVIDTLQLGEIEGIHHGTYKYDMWWWLNRGYTPAGVEAWNCMRALDYLETRPEVDAQRMGATGRSGGGAYTWWITALDDRIKCAVPVAGITDLQNYVVDGCVEGHCDCMFFCNTYQWDYPLVAALVAPRPLLIGNSDRDTIFPFDGVVRTYEKTRRIYELYGAGDKIGLSMGPGPHKDTPELQVAAFRWFDVHLKKVERVIDKPAIPFFEPEQLRVFKDKLPANQENTKIQENFTATALSPALLKDKEDWSRLRDGWMKGVREEVIRAWPREDGPLEIVEADATVLDGKAYRWVQFTSQEGIRLQLFMFAEGTRGVDEPRTVQVNVMDQQYIKSGKWLPRDIGASWFDPNRITPGTMEQRQAAAKIFARSDVVQVHIFPRGVGPTAWTEDPKKNLHIRRRFYLLGQTQDAAQVYDIRRALMVVRAQAELKDRPVFASATGPMATNLMLASLFEPKLAGLTLEAMPSTNAAGPYWLNFDRVCDSFAPVLAMAAERTPVMLVNSPDDVAASYGVHVAKRLAWSEAQLRQLKTSPTK